MFDNQIIVPDLGYFPGGIAAHVSPFVTPADLGSLLTNSRFCMVTLDSDDVTITYPDLYFLLRDLQVGQNKSLLFCFMLLARCLA